MPSHPPPIAGISSKVSSGLISERFELVRKPGVVWLIIDGDIDRKVDLGAV